jgi:integrase
MRRNELACLLFEDIDWDSRELVVQRGVAKNHNARRIPIEDGLWEILLRRQREAPARQPGQAADEATDARVRALFSREHVFVTRLNTPWRHNDTLYANFMRYCRKAGIITREERADGRIVHVDIHGLRRTFATDLFVNRADPKTVQELMGHKTLEMTMNLYAKIHAGTKRSALGRLSYGVGARAPEHVVEFPSKANRSHKVATSGQDRTGWRAVNL